MLHEQEKPQNCVPPEVSSVSAADEARSDSTNGRRIVVASSVMSDERAARSSAHRCPLNIKSYLTSTLLDWIVYSTVVRFLI